jgi:type II secretory pathway pseudopilin PulG
MNNKNLTIKKAFSLVEIMFVISIITFLSVSSVTYFNNFVDSKRIEKDTDFINNSIENLNYKVKNRECYDYEIIFSINNDYLTYKLNQTIKKTETNLIIDKNLKSFTMSTNLPTA